MQTLVMDASNRNRLFTTAKIIISPTSDAAGRYSKFLKNQRYPSESTTVTVDSDYPEWMSIVIAENHGVHTVLKYHIVKFITEKVC